jgi:hypothetical protein
MLHAHYGWRLRSALLSRGGSGLFLMTVPSYLREPPVEGSEEEAGPFPAAAAIRQSAR